MFGYLTSLKIHILSARKKVKTSGAANAKIRAQVQAMLSIPEIFTE